ncbi:RING-H2 finger protein ATL43 [Trifolium repens]|nr:RING-H2 finger protein ATL43 [Trifolium repens]
MVFLVLLQACSYGRSIERSISKTDLENLPCYDYVAKENRSNSLECAICLENFTIGDKCRLLPICKHSFHAKCVDKWLLKNSLCPICRSRVCILCANNI